MKVGVLAVQGDFEKHIEALRLTEFTGLDIREIRTPQELAQVERLIIPGGESTTVGLLLQRFGLATALAEAADEGMPIWGTCMGMIMLASEVIDRPTQFSLGLLDIAVRRNAFGAQVHSFEDHVMISGLDEPVMGVFIRAPVVERCGPRVEVLGIYENRIVAVRQGSVLGTSFHPELTDDTRFHSWFLTI